MRSEIPDTAHSRRQPHRTSPRSTRNRARLPIRPRSSAPLRNTERCCRPRPPRPRPPTGRIARGSPCPPTPTAAPPDLSARLSHPFRRSRYSGHRRPSPRFLHSYAVLSKSYPMLTLEYNTVISFIEDAFRIKKRPPAHSPAGVRTPAPLEIVYRSLARPTSGFMSSS